MPADISLYAKTQRRLRFIPEADDLKSAVKDGMYLSELETGPRAEIKQSRYIRRYQHTRAKPERGPVRWQVKGVGDRRRRKEIGRSRIEPSLAVRIYMQGRRKEEVNAFSDASR